MIKMNMKQFNYSILSAVKWSNAKLQAKEVEKEEESIKDLTICLENYSG